MHTPFNYRYTHLETFDVVDRPSVREFHNTATPVIRNVTPFLLNARH